MRASPRPRQRPDSLSSPKLVLPGGDHASTLEPFNPFWGREKKMPSPPWVPYGLSLTGGGKLVLVIL